MPGRHLTRTRLSLERRWNRLVEAIAKEVDRHPQIKGERAHRAAMARIRLLTAQGEALAAERRVSNVAGG